MAPPHPVPLYFLLISIKVSAQQSILHSSGGFAQEHAGDKA
jgi:hypothetical protein